MYQKALDTLDKFGFVTDSIAPILGMPSGTPSEAAKNALAKAEYELEKELRGYQNEIDKVDRNKAWDIAKWNEEKKAKDEEAHVKKQREDFSGQVSAYLTSLSADEAQKYLNENYYELNDIMGGDLFRDIVKQVTMAKQTEFTNNEKLKSDALAEERDKRAEKQLSISEARLGLAEQSAARVANRAGSNDEKSQIADYNATIQRDYYDSKTKEVDYEGLRQFLEGLVSSGASENVINSISRRWNFDENKYNAVKTYSDFKFSVPKISSALKGEVE
jgi:hypothetical protein